MFPTPSNTRWQSYSDQLPPISSKVADFLFKPVNGVQRCIGTQKQTAKGMAVLKSTGYNILNAHYQLGLCTYGPDAGQPDANAVRTIVNGDWGSRWSSYKTLDYLFQVNKETGKRKHNGQEKWWLLAISDPQCRTRILADLLADISLVPGTGGVFLDEFVPYKNNWFDGDENGFFSSNASSASVWTPQPPWTQQMQDWLMFLVTNLHAKGLWVIANLGNLTTSWAEPTTGADCVMVEQFCNRGLYSGSDWVLAMNRCLKLNVPLILQSALSEVDRSFFFASALLLDNVFVNICSLDSANTFWWPEMEWVLQVLGKPLSRSTVEVFASDSVNVRLFENGLVLVNPSVAILTITLPSLMLPLSFTGGGLLTDSVISGDGFYVGGAMLRELPTSSITLQPGTGAILLNSGIAPPPPPITTVPKLTLTIGTDVYDVTLTKRTS